MLDDGPAGSFLLRLRRLFDDAGSPRSSEMHDRAAARSDPTLRAELTARAPAAATTTGRRLSDLISGDTLPQAYELFDLLNALLPDAPGGDDLRGWLADLDRARTGAAPEAAPVATARRPRRRWALSAGVAVVLAAAAGTGLALSGTGSARTRHPTVTETAGGNARTWSDYRIAGGTPGVALVTRQQVPVECRVTGFRVDDGDVWWYRLGGDYGGRFYATADAFYNEPPPANGSLKGTPFFDPAVPIC